MDPITISLIGTAIKHVPDLLSLFGNNKAADVATKVLDIAKTVTGEDSAEKAMEVINSDPNTALQFKKAVLDQKVALEEIAYKRDKLAVDAVSTDIQDTQNARKRDVEMRTLGQGNTRANLMILGDVVGLLACLGAMVYITWLGVYGGGGDTNPIIMAINGPLGMLTQQFANGLRDAHQFEFGSSRGSELKTQIMARNQGQQ